MWLYFHTINHAIQVFFKVIFLEFVDAIVMCIKKYERGYLQIGYLQIKSYLQILYLQIKIYLQILIIQISGTCGASFLERVVFRDYVIKLMSDSF